jgi:hypothetical protein
MAAAPTANAGADQTLSHDDLPALVTLSGLGTDPDGGSIVGYAWTAFYVPPGSTAALSSTTVAAPAFTADVAGTYRFCLEVEDSGGEVSGSGWYTLPVSACTHVMVTTAHEGLVLPAKGQRNTWEQQNDWARALDTLSGAYAAFVDALASDTASDEGATLVGTDGKPNLCAADTVEEALECLDTALTTAGPYLPLAAGSGAVLTGTVYSDNGLTGRGTDGTAATEAGTAVELLGGTGAAATGAAAAGWGGAGTLRGGVGGAASSAYAGAQGGAVRLQGGTGGAGTATHAGGNGGSVSVQGGAGGASGGAGAGTPGSVSIGASNTTQVTLGTGGVAVQVDGTLNIAGGWQIGGALVPVDVTAAALDTLTDGSVADDLHVHAWPWPISTTNWEVTTTTGRTLLGRWALPSTPTALVNLQCYGACATTDGDGTNCVLQLRDNADSTTLLEIAIADNECGDTTGDFERWNVVTTITPLSGTRSGALAGSRSAGSGTCELAAVNCVIWQ